MPAKFAMYVFLENVAALRSRGLGTVLAGLAALGYDTQWASLRASDTAPATAATGYSSSPASPLPAPSAGCLNNGEPGASWLARRDWQDKPGPDGNGPGAPLAIAIRLLPTPMASDGAPERNPHLGGQRPSGAKRQVGLPEVIACHLAALPAGDGTVRAAGRERLLPTPDTGTSPNGHGRRGGRPGNGHQSGNGLDAAARTLAAGTARVQPLSQAPVAWGEY